MTFGSPRGKWQHWVKPIKGLNGALFIHTEHRGADGWLEVQSDNIGCLLFKFRIVAI